ncbi:uncharacterized protein LOC121384105 [Gigantopelta aegis]|uniref:uncharacterized protein LOC121384105 n=1 Tax=Gigantopelta aegis TaxID=1735272 RepID=UPI001B8883AB|nr:uncharacterized protein LOC121384105 [Gigantopelta aegis]
MDLEIKISNFENDFTFLQDVKKYVMDEIRRLGKEQSASVDSEVKTGYRRKTESGQGIRLVLPQGVSAARVLLGPEEGWSGEGSGSSDVTVTAAVGRSEAVAKSPTVAKAQAVAKSDTVAPLYFVGFIGDAKPESTVSTDLWSVDEQLIRELTKARRYFSVLFSRERPW